MLRIIFFLTSFLLSVVFQYKSFAQCEAGYDWGKAVWRSDNKNCYYPRVHYDYDGNIIISFSFSSDTIMIDDEVIVREEGGSNGIVAKLTPEGELLWYVKVKGIYVDLMATTVDEVNNIYVSGVYIGHCKIGEKVMYSQKNYEVIMMIKISASGEMIWMEHFVGDFMENSANQKIYYKNQHVYFAMGIASKSITFGDTSISKGDYCYDIAMVKFDTSGKVNRVFKVGIDGFSEESYGIYVDNQDFIYLCGWFERGSNIYKDYLEGWKWRNTFVAKYNQNGDVLWVNGPTDNGLDRIYPSDAYGDSNGNIYLAGIASGDSLFVDELRQQINTEGPFPDLYYKNLYLIKFSSDGHAQWIAHPKTFGEWNRYIDRINLYVDPVGNSYIGAAFGGDSMIFDSIKIRRAPIVSDAFVVKYNTEGIAKWVLLINGNHNETPGDIWGSPSGNKISIVGELMSDTLIIDNDTIVAHPQQNGRDYYYITIKNDMSTNIRKKDISCFGDDDGAVDVFVSAAKQPFDIQWSNSNSSQSQKDLPPGKYSVIVTDARNCKAYDTVQIISPDAALSLQTDVVHDSLDKGRGKAIVIPSGGTPPYSYQWDDPNKQTNDTAINLFEGTYTVTVADAHGCIKTTSVMVEGEVGINEDINNKGIQIYPNPSPTGLIRISWDNQFYQMQIIEVFDSYGKSVFTASELDNKNYLDIDIYKSGLYFVKSVNKKNNVFFYKLVLY
jgi:hypothetical protein